MRIPFTLVILLMIAPALEATGQSVSGIVTDADDGTPLAGATVEFVERGIGTITATDGTFAMGDIEEGWDTLRVRFMGYETVERRIQVPTVGLAIAMPRADVQIEEVVVTASPLGSGVRYQPVQALGREELERRSASSFGEMLDGNPGVAMRSFGPAPARPVIRGFDGDRVVVLENGERPGDLSETAADHALAIDPLVADRVEIVRGPASLLYGSGAIGGVVNVLTDDIPRMWDLGLQGEVALQSSSVNRQAAAYGRMRFGSPHWLVGGRIAARGAGDVRTPEGRLPDTDLRNVDAGMSIAVRSGDLSGGAMISGVARTYGLPESIDDPDGRVEIRMQRQTLNARGFWDGAGPLDAVELRLHVGRYAHDEIEIEGGTEDLELSFDQRVASATVLARHGLIGRGAAGVNVFARDLRVGGDEALTPNGRATRLAAFLFEEFDLSRTVTLQAAVRAEAELLSVRPNSLFPEADDNRRAAALSSALGLNVRPMAGWEVGVQFAQAYRSPTIEERYSDAPHIGAGAYEIGDPDLGRERALGLDGFVHVTAGPAALEAAAFAVRIADFVVYQPTGEVDGTSGLPIFVYEAADAIHVGGELTATLALRPWLQIRGSGDFVRGTRLGGGTPLPMIPPVRGMLGLLLDRPPWWAGARVRAVGAQRRTAPNEETTDGYFLTGLEGGLRLGAGRRHVITFRADNLLDIAYRDHLSRVEARQAPMPGRNVNLTYRVMW